MTLKDEEGSSECLQIKGIEGVENGVEGRQARESERIEDGVERRQAREEQEDGEWSRRPSGKAVETK